MKKQTPKMGMDHIHSHLFISAHHWHSIYLEYTIKIQSKFSLGRAREGLSFSKERPSRKIIPFPHTSSVKTGMVMKHMRVLTRTQLAESSVSLWWISAILRMMEAQGVLESTSRLALKEKGRGRK